MKKKVISVLLAVSMLATLVAGCGEKETQNDVKQESSVAESETTDAASEEKDAEPVEKPVLTYYILDSALTGLDLVEEKFNEMLEGRLDATVDFICHGSLNEKINMMTTAGEEFDLMFSASWMNPNYTVLAKKGALVELSDLVEQYGSAIKEVVPQDILDSAKVDGGMYAIPNYQTSVKEYNLVMSQELVDKYDLDLEAFEGSVDDGTFVEKLEAVLEVIKQNEPDLIPLNNKNMDCPIIGNVEPLSMVTQNVILDTVTGELIPLTEHTKEYARVLCDWYDKGYIREDIATITDDSADVKAGRYAVNVATDAREGNKVNFASTYGIQGEVACVAMSERYSFMNHTHSAMTAISATSKHPELAMQLINLLFEDAELYNTVLWGVEGTHWTMNDDGTIKQTEAGKGYSIPGWRTAGSTYSTYVLEGNDPNLPQMEKDYMASSRQSDLNGFIFDSTNVSAEIANISTVGKEFSHITNGSCGLVKFDEEFAKFEKALEAAG